MNTEEILAKLETHDYANFQREALHAAILQQEAITPALLDIVGRIADTPRNSSMTILIIWGLPMPYFCWRNLRKIVLTPHRAILCPTGARG